MLQRRPRIRDDAALRGRLEELAARYRRYGLPRMLVLLRCEGISDNHKRVGRVYRAAQLQVRKRVHRKLALGRGVPPPILAQANLRWSLDFVHDSLAQRPTHSDLSDARRTIEEWRQNYNTLRPHGSLDHRTPEAFARRLLNLKTTEDFLAEVLH